MHRSETPRAPGSSGPPAPTAARRSDATRAAILDAARERFATDGYERTTIRAIARDAGIDPSMVMRYYGNKEGLFAAAVSVDLRMPDLGAVPRDELGRVLVTHFLTQWEENEQLTALLRVGATSRAGAQRMQGVFRDQLLPAARAACPDPEQAPARAALVSTQLLGLALTRYVLHLPPVAALTRDEIAAWLGPTVQRYMVAPHP
ncbi:MULTISPECIES: TetR family transcriptional regulator [unclassified Streptomyces]|uniref:TetR/AcrR family transcriptional regulator n=1 Tax=unclassified Streptomyces TaxID=2593676 RepID=UPI001F03F797|nr:MULTISPECIES: TetR family transcriptional regulator [unclassified Streptomyces]MCH0564970.1 TetR family transcriptional regulator [Streptomyces sp. MUM 2J]MCH0569970.1 TetR family transcriptional regulator [Streptomyces sp. MUM 136J]